MSGRRLSEQSLASISPHIGRPAYARSEQSIGIVHFGLGAFHRAHQAAYTDRIMSAGERGWAIAGVSLRSTTSRDQLAPQDGLYTVTERSPAETRSTLIGSIREVLTAPVDASRICAAVASPQTRILSFTVTEKGYSAAPGGELDVSNNAIEADLSGQSVPATIYGFLHAGLSQRRESGQSGLSLLSCDNLASNGQVLRSLLLEFLDRRDPSLGAWVEAECAFPSTMVDRIVPATSPADLDEIEGRIGLRDEGAVVTELFSQWVIEDRFAAARPAWDRVGAQFVDDVAVHEAAKLRILNAAHSALAYLGLARGHSYVHEAIADPAVRSIVVQLMREEAAPTLPASFAAGIYIDQLLTRFANAALPHRLEQIATDGSQKISQRWLATLADNQRAGRPCPAILEALAAWMLHVRGDRGPVADPLAGELAAAWIRAGEQGIVRALFGAEGRFPTWTPGADDERVVRAKLAAV